MSQLEARILARLIADDYANNQTEWILLERGRGEWSTQQDVPPPPTTKLHRLTTGRCAALAASLASRQPSGSRLANGCVSATRARADAGREDGGLPIAGIRPLQPVRRCCVLTEHWPLASNNNNNRKNIPPPTRPATRLQNLINSRALSRINMATVVETGTCCCRFCRRCCTIANSNSAKSQSPTVALASSTSASRFWHLRPTALEEPARHQRRPAPVALDGGRLREKGLLISSRISFGAPASFGLQELQVASRKSQQVALMNLPHSSVSRGSFLLYSSSPATSLYVCLCVRVFTLLHQHSYCATPPAHGAILLGWSCSLLGERAAAHLAVRVLFSL